LKGPYPFRPTQLALEKTEEFFTIVSAKQNHAVTQIPKNAAREKQLMDEQKAWVKKLATDSFDAYENMRGRLKTGGPNASFPEFQSVVEYLELKLKSDDMVAKLCRENPHMAAFRELALQRLAQVRNSSLPYRTTVDAIQRSLEFYDVAYRAVDPKRSPALYHSGRYEYYTHFLEAAVPDHIMLPTLSSLGATDILKSRGVPIGLLGVNTDIAWVDGYYQTPYEFYVHDVNHTRRMYQFLKEDAAAKGIPIEQYAKQSDEFVKTKLMPLITVNKGDDEITKNQKRLRKILLFEILHEDALPASPDIIEKAMLRPPMQLTPFETMLEGKKVAYVMEPGATTLAYVHRKLAHDFYDMPRERIDNIVAPEFRTRKNIVEAAETVFKALGLPVNKPLFEHYVTTDQGFPGDFRNTLVKDIAARPNETIPLNEAPQSPPKSVEAVVSAQRIPSSRTATPEQISEIFKAKNKKVVTLIGYSGAEYQDKNAMLVKVREILSSYDPKTTIVNIGATPEGVGAAYEVAKELGFETTGIVSSQAEKYGGNYSKFVDQVFVVTDETWGGFVNGTYKLSPTSTAMVKVSDDVFTIGGGEVGADESRAARMLGKKVTFIPADMNHQLAINKAVKKGQPAPTDFKGAAHTVLSPETHSEGDIHAFFKAKGKQVVTFVGYSGAEYEDKAKMISQARRILEGLDPKTTIVNIGATPEGIGSVYQLAKSMGFETTGVVSAQAKKYGQASPYVDRVFFVEDESWGGYNRATKELNPTSKVMVDVSDRVVAIGGGEVGADEILAAKLQGKRVDFFEADMSHRLAIEKAAKKGLPEPTNFKGAAAERWKALSPHSSPASCMQLLLRVLTQ
jgi:Fe-S cluster assembly iron-binding protein IscA